jgi:leader peptidase (prepilin peptidase)/N-methyltransferase
LRYPLIELLAAILAVVTVWQLGFSWQSLFALILGWSLLTLAVIDLDHMILPDHITQPLLWMGLLLSVWSVFCDPTSSILGAICGYGLLWSLYQGFKLFTGKEGMGYGDFKLLALLGAWMGWQALPLVILLSSLAGSLIGIAMIVFKRHERGQPLPFGPFLAVAGWVTLLWQEPLYDAYWRILGP